MARTTDLDPEGPFRDGMRGLIATRFAAVWKAVPVAVAGVDPEGVHDVRVASRRLRAAMDVAADSFPEAWYRELHAVAKAITSELGEVRDRDVMLAFLTAERKSVSPNESVGIDRLIHRIEHEREGAREHMLAFLARLDSNDVQRESFRRFGDAASPGAATQAGG